MDKKVLMNELIRKKQELENNPNVSPIDLINEIMGIVNKCPDDRPQSKKIVGWRPKKEYLDVLDTIFKTRRLSLYDKNVVLQIYNEFHEILES